MLVGHYAGSFVLKKVYPSVPLWLLVLGAQVLDMLFFLFCVLGWEGYTVNPALRGPQSMDLHTHHLSHSLIGSLVISTLGYLVVRFWRRAYAWPVALVIFSHFVADVVVHRPDLVIWQDFKIGLGLWDYVLGSYVFELVLVTGAFFWMIGKHPTSREIYLLAILYSSQTIFAFFLPLPNTPIYFLLLAWSVMALQTRAAAIAENSRNFPNWGQTPGQTQKGSDPGSDPNFSI